MYEIITRTPDRYGGWSEWSTDGVGENGFDTAEEALIALRHLGDLGDEWADAEYNVQEVA
jgi:hypothetical protein